MFTHYELNENGEQDLAYFREKLKNAMDEILPLLPEGREKSIFKTKLEEAAFWAVKAISSLPENIEVL